MSRVRVKCTPQVRRRSALADAVTLGPRILTQTVKGVGEVLQSAVEASSPIEGRTVSGLPELCEIPETECPPRCVCHIEWEASPRERLVCRIKVTNSSKVERVFTIEAKPFPGAAGTIDISPAQMQLAPDQTGIATATYGVPALSPGTYETEILVTGAYEQCIEVTLKVHGHQECECHVVQGEIPTRIRAHHWYDHFQCVERCFEPARRKVVEKDPAGKTLRRATKG